MRFRYAVHALDRCSERGVTKAEVEECVRRATSIFRTRKGNQYRAEMGGRRLKVVVAEDQDTADEKFVITVIVEGDDDS
ncbi:MAG: DUF4258 domain-containing protein [Pseudonocardiaceae bacterium]